jgi:pimeloyl-ACP methyl ester carboxylesterase
MCRAGTAARIGSAELWEERIARVEAEGVEAIAATVVERWFGPAFKERDPIGVRGYRTLLSRTPRAGYLATLHALKAADLRQRVQAIAVPTLCIAGELDVATPPQALRELAAAINGAEFESIPGAAHLMSVEEPELFARALLRFLGDHGLV